MEFYPFVKFENRADSVGGLRFIVERLGSAAVPEQTQRGHNRLCPFFEVYEIEFAKNHWILDLHGVCRIQEDCRKHGKSCD